MKKSVFNIFAVIVYLTVAVSGFHMQNSPAQIARVCTPQVVQICQSASMRCRANQAFDNDIPHAVCDRLNGRTRGIRPGVLLARQGGRTGLGLGGDIGGFGTRLNGRSFGLGRQNLGIGLGGSLGGGLTGANIRGLEGGLGEFGGQSLATARGFGSRQNVGGGFGRLQLGGRGSRTSGLVGGGLGGGLGGGALNTQLNSLGGGTVGRQLGGGLGGGLGAGLNSGIGEFGDNQFGNGLGGGASWL